ncbi:type II toxin-antitoxin system RelE/ParE family toxin [Sodalinema gerasimenkoae]|uniref:type II toxin-antitoxin system RelE/ParE family toxin n=1 Tax=Sodalinema gerasimenkoae TaxID=2862348 RepID=UPI001356C301|nr:type II toxin-antitoxin system RelE/ParE family toxin [Sodalinema gerasimenkoae]
MPSNSERVTINLTPEYRKSLKKLAKKYRNIRSDTQGLIERLQQGDILGDRICGFGETLCIYKVRAKNSNIQKGKSSGYRILYLLESGNCILLLTIYSKLEQQDISNAEIQEILDNCDQET